MPNSFIQILSSKDLNLFQELILLFEEVFEMKDLSMPEEGYLKEMLGKEDFDVFVALQEGKVVGGLTVYTLQQYYSKSPLAYIYDLAVATDLQRQGIGQQLIAATKEHYKNLGYEEVFVQADQEEAHAVNFYRKTQPTEEEDVSHFYYSLQGKRPDYI